MGICFHKTQEISVSSSPSTPSRTRNRYHIKKSSLRRTRPVPLILPRPVSRRQTGRVLGRPFDDIRDVYEMGVELGRGQFGITYMCRDKATGVEYACKSISRQNYRGEGGAEDLRREISVMQHLSGHPNIVKFKGVYEDRHNLHLVMELCSGGELFDRIVEKGSYSERTAACLFTQILKVIHVCHFMGVIHRDLKPENFLFLTRDDDSPLKVTDFGLSIFLQEGKVYHDFAGSSYYIAPEVIQSSYGKEIDIWSAGIILYILLSGGPPFFADTEKGIFRAIQETNLDFQSSPWPSISHSAKDLVRRMLARNPKHRITASEALQHPWLREDCSEALKKPMDSAVLHRMKQFKAMNKMKKLALKVIAENLTEKEINGLKATFNNMDTDRSGRITVEELRVGLGTLGSRPTEAEIEQLIVAVDVDCSGTLDYLEFITATMNRHRLHREDILLKAFSHFDTDDSGYITKREMIKAIEESISCKEKWSNEMDGIMNDIDINTDGKINYEEFVFMMRTRHPPA